MAEIRRFSTFQLTAEAYDFDDDQRVDIFWYSNLDGYLGQGEHLTTSLRHFGAHELSAIAVEPSGQVSQKKLAFNLQDHPPIIEMVEPTNDAILFSEQAYLFQVNVSDPDRLDGHAPCHQVRWSLVDEFEYQRLGRGCHVLVDDLRPGVHVLRVDAQDETGTDNFRIIRYTVRP